ncbi:MAG: hypothetical protein ABIG96_03140 [Candidatus Micrarchaeota archaeon]
MRKAVFFALLYGAFFMLTLSLALFYSSHISESERTAVDGKKYMKFSYVADDVGTDILSLLGIEKIALGRNGSVSEISITERLPSPYADPDYELSRYGEFAEGEYAKRNNLQGKISLETGALGSPFIYFSGPEFNYSYSGLGKSGSLFVAGPSLEKISVSISSGKDAIQACGWTQLSSGSMEAVVDFNSPNCMRQTPSINALAPSSFWANTSSGKYINLTFGVADGNFYALKIAPDSVPLEVQINVSYSYEGPVSAYLPAGITYSDGYSLSALPIVKN